MKASGVSLMPALRRRILQLAAQCLELGDVRLIELRDVRDVDPACMQARARNPLDARQRLRLDGAELREVDGRNDRQRAAARLGVRCGARCRHEAFDESFDVIVRDAALEPMAGDSRQVDAQLARELAHRSVPRAPGRSQAR